MITIFESLDDVPQYDPENHIWKAVDSDEVKSVCILQIFGELEKDTALMTDVECRSVLSRIQGYFNTIMIKQRIETAKVSKEEQELESQNY